MIVAFSVTPAGVGDSVSEHVAAAVRVVRESGLPHSTDAMFTTVEGEWDEVMDVVRRAVEAVQERAPRVGLVLKADIRPGRTGMLTAKLESLERALAPGEGAPPTGTAPAVPGRTAGEPGETPPTAPSIPSGG